MDQNKICGGLSECFLKVRPWISVFLIVVSIFFVIKAVAEFEALDYIGGNPSNAASVSVSGKADIMAIPDIATFSFTGRNEAKTVSLAQEKTTVSVNKAIDFLKKSGVEEKDIKTSGYNVYPKYSYTPCVYVPSYDGSVVPCSSYGKQVLVGYEVSESVDVKVRKIDDAGKLLTGVTDSGITEVSSLSLQNENHDDLVKQARSKAIADAKIQAKKLASDLGVKLVRILSYSDGGQGYPVYYERAMLSSKASGDNSAQAPTISPGENKITSNVTITYEIK